MKNWLIKFFGGYTDADVKVLSDQAYVAGKKEAKVCFAPLPLDFTREELAGREYGQFITPGGFATVLGECSVPAPGPHGYEQRAYYVSRRQLDDDGTKFQTNGDLHCHKPMKFENPMDSHELVPVIVTVLR